MVKRYLGGIISATLPTVNQATASGVWSPSYQLQQIAAGLWPGSITGSRATVVLSFTATGSWVCPAGVTSVDYLVVAGGGGGGAIVFGLEISLNTFHWPFTFFQSTMNFS